MIVNADDLGQSLGVNRGIIGQVAKARARRKSLTTDGKLVILAADHPDHARQRDRGERCVGARLSRWLSDRGAVSLPRPSAKWAAMSSRHGTHCPR